MAGGRTRTALSLAQEVPAGYLIDIHGCRGCERRPLQWSRCGPTNVLQVCRRRPGVHANETLISPQHRAQLTLIHGVCPQQGEWCRWACADVIKLRYKFDDVNGAPYAYVFIRSLALNYLST